MMVILIITGVGFLNSYLLANTIPDNGVRFENDKYNGKKNIVCSDTLISNSSAEIDLLIEPWMTDCNYLSKKVSKNCPAKRKVNTNSIMDKGVQFEKLVGTSE